MQISSLLLLALSAMAIASPSATEADSEVPVTTDSEAEFNGTFTEHHLEKRGTYGWVTSYQNLDILCKGGYAMPRPKIEGRCVNFSPKSRNIGINWGTWPDAFGSLDIYRDANCINKITTVKGPRKHERVGAQTCWHTDGKQVRSVRSSDASP